MIDYKLKQWLKNEMGIDFTTIERLPTQIQLANRSRKENAY